MMNSFFSPRYGETVPLICLKCHKRFSGPNPTGRRIFEDIFKRKKRAMCPECGSRRIVRNPWVSF